MKAFTVATLSILAIATLNVQAYAGANDFFGSSLGAASGPVGGGSDSAQGGSGIVNAAAGVPTSPPPGDYSADEKRVQKKYKSGVNHARKLIAKGEAMMKSQDEKEAKKGRILKDIGERRLAELKSNNPFPEIAGREPKKLPN